MNGTDGAPAAKPEKVTKTEHALKKPHTHGGVDHAAGEKIELDTDQVARLKKRGII